MVLLFHIRHIRKTGRNTGPGCASKGEEIMECLHCGGDQYVSPEDGNFVYRCHGRYDNFAASCCWRLKCMNDSPMQPCKGC